MPLNLAAIAALRTRILDATADAAANVILAKANAQIPVDAGVALASGRVVRDDAAGIVYVTYGKDDDGDGQHAPSNQYIEVLHENMEHQHPQGGNAKFLENAANDASGSFGQAIAEKAQV